MCLARILQEYQLSKSYKCNITIPCLLKDIISTLHSSHDTNSNWRTPTLMNAPMYLLLFISLQSVHASYPHKTKQPKINPNNALLNDLNDQSSIQVFKPVTGKNCKTHGSLMIEPTETSPALSNSKSSSNSYNSTDDNMNMNINMNENAIQN